MKGPAGRPPLDRAEALARDRLEVLADVRGLRRRLARWDGLLTAFEGFLINDRLWQQTSAAGIEKLTRALAVVMEAVEGPWRGEPVRGARPVRRTKPKRVDERLRALLRARVSEAGLTPEELGGRLGWGKKKVQAVFRGGDAPLKLGAVFTIVEALGVPPAELFRDLYGWRRGAGPATGVPGSSSRRDT